MCVFTYSRHLRTKSTKSVSVQRRAMARFLLPAHLFLPLLFVTHRGLPFGSVTDFFYFTRTIHSLLPHPLSIIHLFAKKRKRKKKKNPPPYNLSTLQYNTHRENTSISRFHSPKKSLRRDAWLIICSGGRPRTSIMQASCSISSSPGNKGQPV